MRAQLSKGTTWPDSARPSFLAFPVVAHVRVRAVKANNVPVPLPVPQPFIPGTLMLAIQHPWNYSCSWHLAQLVPYTYVSTTNLMMACKHAVG